MESNKIDIKAKKASNASNASNEKDRKKVSFSLPDTKPVSPRTQSSKPTYAGILKGEK